MTETLDIKLGVNIDHIATLRNARGEKFPDPIKAAEIALNSGADSITAHLREDRRHIKDEDISNIIKKFPGKLNLEIAANEEMKNIALEVNPFSCCIVPERREEVTTEGGLDVLSNSNYYKNLNNIEEWVLKKGIFAKAFKVKKNIDCQTLGFQTAARSNLEACRTLQIWTLTKPDAKVCSISDSLKV